MCEAHFSVSPSPTARAHFLSGPSIRVLCVLLGRLWTRQFLGAGQAPSNRPEYACPPPPPLWGVAPMPTPYRCFLCRRANAGHSWSKLTKMVKGNIMSMALCDVGGM